jgi:hypothetical protein
MERGLSVVVRQGGPVYVVGIHAGGMMVDGAALPSKGDDDLFIVAVSAGNGSHLWSASYGGPGGDYAADVALTPDGGLALVGWFHQTIDLGGGKLTCPDAFTDGFVLKLKPK